MIVSRTAAAMALLGLLRGLVNSHHIVHYLDENTLRPNIEVSASMLYLFRSCTGFWPSGRVGSLRRCNIAGQHATENGRFDSHSEFYRNSKYKDLPQEHRFSGSLGVSMIEVEKGPNESTDAAVPEFVITSCRSRARNVTLDIGDGPNTFKGGGVVRGTISIIPPETSVRCRVSDPHKLLIATVPKDWRDRIQIEDNNVPDGFSCFYGRVQPAPRIAHVMKMMWEAAEYDGPSSTLVTDGLTLLLLGLLSDDAGIYGSSSSLRNEDARIHRVIDYVEANFGEPLTVAELAAVACLSPGHFSRTFKSTTGEAIWAFVRRRRCERAKELLTGTNFSTAEIAYRCGFGSQSHLTTSLRDMYGITPGILRQQK